MSDNEIHERILEDSLRDILADPQFRSTVSSGAARRVRKRRHGRQLMAGVAAVMLLALVIRVIPWSSPSDPGPALHITNESAPTTSPDHRAIVVHTLPSRIETVHTYRTGMTVLSTADSSSSIPRINDAELLQLLAHRDPVLLCEQDGQLRLILAN